MFSGSRGLSDMLVEDGGVSMNITMLTGRIEGGGEGE
jgi:hypothetical protein